MRNRKTRLLSLILALALTFTVMPTYAFATAGDSASSNQSTVTPPESEPEAPLKDAPEGTAALIGDAAYGTLSEAFKALKDGDTLTILAGTYSEGTIKLKSTLNNVTVKGANGHTAVLKDMVIMSADGNSVHYDGLTFDGIVFEGSRLLFTGQRNGEVVYKDFTVNNCIFNNIVNDGNLAAVHFNTANDEVVTNFTFTNNVIDGTSGSSMSGVHLQCVGGNINISNNVLKNLVARSYHAQIQNGDGIADSIVMVGNTVIGSPEGRTHILGKSTTGADSVSVVYNKNIHVGITTAYMVCFYNFNGEMLTADLGGNYFDADIVSDPTRIYVNSKCLDVDALVSVGMFPIYTELNEDGTIDLTSAVGDPTAVGFAGSGTAADPYLITSVNDLVLFRDSVNAGETKYNAEGVYVALAGNIDMTGIDWSVNIGDAADASFDGIFDGKGYKIANLTSTETAKDPYGYTCTGLFGCIAGNAVIKNLTIENATINAAFTGNNAAVLVGFVYMGAPVIENVNIVNATLNAPATYGVGAIVGYAYQSALTVKNVTVSDSTIVSKSGAGAIVGYAGGTVTAIGCSVEGVSVSGTAIVGGIIGVSVGVNKVENATVSDVTLTASGANWVNSAAVVIGSIAVNNVAISGTVSENVTVNGVTSDKLVGSIYAEKPESVVPALVANVGNKYYTTLADAIAAVEDGGTVTLLADEIFTASNRTHNSDIWYDGIYYVGDKSFTIDLGGFTIKQDGSVNDYLLNFKNDGAKANVITIKNGTVDAGTAAYCALCTSSASTQQITINLEGVSLINNISNGSTVKLRGGAVLNVNNGTTITGKDSYLAIECVASTVNVNDGAKIYMNGTTSYNGCLVGVGCGGTVNVYGGYGKGVKGGFIAMTSGGTINVYGGEWIANTDGTVGSDSNYYVLTAQSNKYESGFAGASIINVYGGTLRGGMDAWVLNNIEGEKAELNVFGGNFNVNPDRFVEDGYKVVVNNDGSYSVKSTSAVVYTWDELAAAIADANVTDIKLAADIVADGRIVVARNLHIALNGYKLSLTKTNNRVWKAATLTIDGNGEINVSAVDGGNVFYVGGAETGAGTQGHLVLNGIKVTGENYNTGTNAAVFMLYGPASSTLTITNCELNLKNNRGNGSVFYDTGTNNNCKINIVDSDLYFDGTVRGSVCGNITIDNSTVVIKNCDNGFNEATLTIKNGSNVTITDNTGRGITVNRNGYGIVIENSTVTLRNNGEGDIRYKASADIVITNSNLNLCNVVVDSGVNATINGNKIVNGEKVESVDGVVTIKNLVAQVGDNTYVSLQDAINAANGATVVLLGNVTLNEGITVALGTTVTLDLNGYELSFVPTEAASFAGILNYGTLTVKDSSTAKSGAIVLNYNLAGSTSYAANTITNCGTLYIEGGAIKNVSTASYQIGYAIDNNSTVNNAILVISGGTVSVSGSVYYDGIRMFCNSTTNKNSVTVTGGEVSSIWLQNPSDGTNSKNTLDVLGSVTVSGGKVGALYLEPSTEIDAAVSGGYVGSIGYFQTAEGRDLVGFITGGSFGSNVSAFVAEGFTVVDNGNGTYGVEELVLEHIVADRNELQAVLDNCAPGTTIYLTAGVNYGVVYMRPTPGNKATNEVDWVGNNYRYETYSCFEDLTIIGAEGATIDAIVIEGGTYYNTVHSNADIYPVMLSLIELKNVAFKGVTFTGNGGFDPQGYGNAINLSGNNIKVNGLTIEDCVFNNPADNARLLYKTESTSHVHSYVYGGETYTFTPDNKNITITGCTFNGGYMGLELREVENLTITNNEFNSISSRDILIATNSGYTCSGDIVITDNTSNGAGNRFLRASGIGSANLTVSNNDIINYAGPDRDFIKADGITTGTVTVTGNTLDGVEMTAQLSDGTIKVMAPSYVAEVNGVKYNSLEEAIAAAQAGNEIILLDNVTLSDIFYLPADIIFNGNGKTITGEVWAEGNLTFKGYTKVGKFNAGYNKPVITIGEGACLETTNGRMVLGHGATFNIIGTITDAKTADKTAIQPSLIAPGASFTGAGITFNVTNAYIKFSAYCSSKNSSANGTFTFNVTNSIWEQTGNLQFSVPTEGKDPTVNFNLTDSVLTTTGHLIFGIAKGEIVIDNSSVNVGARRQLENRSTLVIKNGSVVYGSVASSQNAQNPGTVIVENATYDVTGEFTGATIGTGTLVIKNGAIISIGSITNANIVIDATGMSAGELANFTANLSKLTGTITVENNDRLIAQIVDGKIVLVVKPVAQIGEVTYTSLEEAIAAAVAGDVIVLLADAQITATTNLTKSITINGNSFKVTQSDDFAGNAANVVFDVYSGTTVTFTNVVFDGIKGVGLIRTVGADLVMDGCTVQNCVQTVAQGLLRLACGNATISNSNFLNNNCTMVVSFGFDAANDTDVLVIDNCVFEGNTCSSTAVVYFAKGDYGKVTGTKFLDNNVSSTGNAATLYMGWGAGYEVKGCTFDGNYVTTTSATAKRFASAIFCDGCVVNNNVFGTNTAVRNGEVISTVVAVGAFYGAADVSGNYWNGGEPAYTVEYTRNEVTLNSYYTEYDAQTGTLSGEVRLDFVAEVDGVKYISLQDAINAANGKTVVLLENVVLEDTLVIPYGITVTLDLNGKTVSQTKVQTAGYQMVLVDGNLTLTDSVGGGKLSYTDAGNGGEYQSNTVTVRGTFTLVSGTVENLSSATVAANGYPYAIDTSIWGNASEVNVIIKGGKVYCQSYSAIRLRGDSTTEAVNVTVEGGEIVGTIEVQNSANVAVGKLTISGGKLSNSGTANVLFFFGNGNTALEAEITGGEFTGNIKFSTGAYIGDAFDKAFVKGGSFTTNVSDYCAEGFTVVDNGDGTYGVEEKKVAQVGNNTYASLQDAINAANGGTVVLLDNVVLEDTLVIAAGVTVTIDLNGFVISGVSGAAAASAVIVNRGHLTVKDSVGGGKITSQALIPDTDWDSAQGTFPSYANNTINNHGTLVLESGILENTSAAGGATYTVDNYGDGEIVVNGGKILNQYNIAIRVFANGNISASVTVNGGEIVGTRAIWIQLPSSNTQTTPEVALNVTGGVLTGTKLDSSGNTLVIYSYSYGSNMKNVSLNISGGTFNGDIALTGGSNKTDLETVVITGGTFNGVGGDVFSYGDSAKAAEAITVTGGNFSANTAVGAYAADDGFTLVAGENGRYNISYCPVQFLGGSLKLTADVASTAMRFGFKFAEGYDWSNASVVFEFATDAEFTKNHGTLAGENISAGGYVNILFTDIVTKNQAKNIYVRITVTNGTDSYTSDIYHRNVLEVAYAILADVNETDKAKEYAQQLVDTYTGVSEQKGDTPVVDAMDGFIA